MGKSDPIVFKKYLNSIPEAIFENIAFLGFPKKNIFTDAVKGKNKNFFDILPEAEYTKEWNINSTDWHISKKYDLVVCTRCAYFSKEPERFIDQCHNILKKGGYLLVDWGLGDHWRFDNYKIGWIKDGEHEYAYKEDNYLWSTIWDEYFLKDDDFKWFAENVKKFGYKDVSKAVAEEFPSKISLRYIFNYFDVQYSMLPLWPDHPQLYIILLCRKRD